MTNHRQDDGVDLFRRELLRSGVVLGSGIGVGTSATGYAAASRTNGMGSIASNASGTTSKYVLEQNGETIPVRTFADTGLPAGKFYDQRVLAGVGQTDASRLFVHEHDGTASLGVAHDDADQQSGGGLDPGAWAVNYQGSSGPFSVALGGTPLVDVYSDGSGNEDFANAYHPDGVSAPVSVTFEGVSATRNDNDDNLFLGLAGAAGGRPSGSGDVSYAMREGDAGSEPNDTLVVDGTNLAIGAVDWSREHDVTIEVTASEATLSIDGVERATASHSMTGPWYVTVTREDDDESGASERVTVQNVRTGTPARIIDDFEDGDLSEYEYTGYGAGIRSDLTYEGKYALSLPSRSASTADAQCVSVGGDIPYPSRGDTFGGYLYQPDETNQFRYVFAAQSASKDPDGYNVAVSGDRDFLIEVDRRGKELARTSLSDVDHTGKWLKLVIDWDYEASTDTTTITATLYDKGPDGTENNGQLAQIQGSESPSTYESGGLAFNADAKGSAMAFDGARFFTREPTDGTVTFEFDGLPADATWEPGDELVSSTTNPATWRWTEGDAAGGMLTGAFADDGSVTVRPTNWDGIDDWQVFGGTTGFSTDFEGGLSDAWQNAGNFGTDGGHLVGTGKMWHEQPAATGVFEVQGVQNSATYYGLRSAFIAQETGYGGAKGYGLRWIQHRDDDDGSYWSGDLRLERLDPDDGGLTMLTKLTEDHDGRVHTVRVERTRTDENDAGDEEYTFEWTLTYEDGTTKSGTYVEGFDEKSYTESNYWVQRHDADGGSQRVDGINVEGSGNSVRSLSMDDPVTVRRSGGTPDVDLDALVDEKTQLIDEIQGVADEVFDLGAAALSNFTGPVVPESELKRLIEADSIVDDRAEQFVDSIPPASERTASETRQYGEALERLVAVEGLSKQAATYPVSNVPPLVPFTPSDDRSIVRQEMGAVLSMLSTVVMEVVTAGAGKLAERSGSTLVQEVGADTASSIFGIASGTLPQLPVYFDSLHHTYYRERPDDVEDFVEEVQENVRQEVESTVRESEERADRLVRSLSVEDPDAIASNGVVDPDRKVGPLQSLFVGVENLLVTGEYGRLMLGQGAPDALTAAAQFDPGTFEYDLPDEEIPDRITIEQADTAEDAVNRFGNWVEDAADNVEQIDYDFEERNLPGTIDLSGLDVPDEISVDPEKLPGVTEFQELAETLEELDDPVEGVDTTLDDVVDELAAAIGGLDEQDDQVRAELTSLAQEVAKDGTVVTYALFDALNAIVAAVDELEFAYDVFYVAIILIATAATGGPGGIVSLAVLEIVGILLVAVSAIIDGTVAYSGRTYVDALRAGHSLTGRRLATSDLSNL